jgi:glycogen synthase
MRIRARELVVGDIVQVNDWQLHITGIECYDAVAVQTAEFGFLIHFGRDDTVTVQAGTAAA